MMSPLSVAQYLPAGERRFDLVVFDEASQICTHDAIGAIARGNQLLVVGDSKQLPPTAFFQRGASDDATTDESGGDELESVLDEALASGIPQDMLGWHYRSRHETLIEFSNQHYYDGRLHIFPAARGLVQDLGVHWHPVPDGVYEAGKTRTNRKEAMALVEHLVTTLRTTMPDRRTFGVVTFSVAQQALIQDLLDDARVTYPEIEQHFSGTTHEPVFIKNLENVQGDERDEILFSIGYGPDERGRLVMNFGPLNRTGGERRLNVAITRAREALHVFSTLTHDRIDLARTTARGSRDLKAFLRFVSDRGGPSALREQTSGDFDSDFERDVHDALVASGHRITNSQVLVAAPIRIDLAIRHPIEPGVVCTRRRVRRCRIPFGRQRRRDRDRLRPSRPRGARLAHAPVSGRRTRSFDRGRELRRRPRGGPPEGHHGGAAISQTSRSASARSECVTDRPVHHPRCGPETRQCPTSERAIGRRQRRPGGLLRKRVHARASRASHWRAANRGSDPCRRSRAPHGEQLRDRATHGASPAPHVRGACDGVATCGRFAGDFVWHGDASADALRVFRFSDIEAERRDAEALPPRGDSRGRPVDLGVEGCRCPRRT